MLPPEYRLSVGTSSLTPDLEVVLSRSDVGVTSAPLQPPASQVNPSRLLPAGAILGAATPAQSLPRSGVERCRRPL